VFAQALVFGLVPSGCSAVRPGFFLKESQMTRFMVRFLVCATVLPILFSSAVARVYSQTETGQITGTVLDPTDAVVPNAQITVKSVATGAVRETASDSEGRYTVANLQPGAYTVSVKQEGFAPFQEAANVTVGAKIGLDLRLALAGSSIKVDVTPGAAPLVNTETQTLGQLVTGEEILQLPTLTRNPYDLVQTVGNVSEADTGNRGAGVAINGLRAASTNAILDGVPNNDEFFGQVGIKVPLDSVQEFNVVTNGFTAEYGRAAAGIVNVATRSGSNDIHGSTYEFNRISALASNTFDNNANALAKGVFARNQFGFSAGGPIIQNKLFIFENTEWTRVRSAEQQSAIIATPQLIAASTPNTQQFFQQLGTLKSNLNYLQTFTAGQVCTSGACLAIPANTPIYQKVSYSVPFDAGGGDPQNTYALVGRVDYNPNQKEQIFFRVARQYLTASPGSQFNSPYAGYDTNYSYGNQGYVVSATHIFSTTLISQTKLSFNRLINIQPLGARPLGPTLFTTVSSALTLPGAGGANIEYPGYVPNNPAAVIPSGGPTNLGAVNQDVNWSLGRHTVRFGGLYNYIQDNHTLGAAGLPVEGLGKDANTALSGLITGQLSGYQAAVNPQGKYPCVNGVATAACTVTLPVGLPNFSRSNRYHEAALYVQDSWKTTRRLTLNLGLRWEYFGPQGNKDPNLDSNFYPGAGANIQQQMGTGQVLLAPKSPIGGLWAKDWTDFAPRVGFAWDVMGDGKTSLRGGYGLGYERNFGNVTFNVIQNPPNYAVLSLKAGSDVPGGIPITTDRFGPLSGNAGSKALLPLSLRAVDPHIKTAYAHQWSLAVERQVGSQMLVGLEYSGSRGENLYTIYRLNLLGSNAVFGGTSPNTRINPQYTQINYRTNGGDSFYQAMNARLEIRNFRKIGLTTRINYTWSHSIDDSSSTFGTDFSGNGGRLGALDPLNPGLDRGDSDFDVRHRIALSAVWQSPFFTEKGLKNWIAGGWNVAPIFSAHTGTPFTVYDCFNQFEGGAPCPRMMFTKPFQPAYTQTSTGNPNEFTYINLASGAPDSSWLNPLSGNSAFGPFPKTMSGRNIFRTPGLWKANLGVYKDFTMTERMKLQFRAESFNLFNHSNLYLVYGNLDLGDDVSAPIVTATRGQRKDTGATTPTVENGRIENRNMQFALKLIF
jgi:outer membrane receptor protein involved in Fe transport